MSWMKRRACWWICSPLGRSLLLGLKSPKQPPLTSQKLDPLPADLLSSSFTVYVCQTPSSISLQLFLQSFSGACACPAVQLHGKGQWSCFLPPSLKLSSPWLALTPRAGIHPPPPTLEETPPRVGCCAVESQPLMGSGGESESEGGGRRIQLKKNDITCAGRSRKRERGR